MAIQFPAGDGRPIIIVEKGNFLFCSFNNISEDYTLEKYSQKGVLLKTSKSKSFPIKDYKEPLPQSLCYGADKLYTIRAYHTDKLNERRYILESRGEKTELTDLSALLPKSPKIFEIGTFLFVDKNLLLTIGTVVRNKKEIDCFFMFDIKKNKMLPYYEFGEAIFYSNWYYASKIMKYADGYILVWSGWPKFENGKPKYPNESIVCFTYLDLKNKKIYKYIIGDGPLPLELSADLIGDSLFVAYTHADKDRRGKIVKKFINLKDLLKQKPVSVNGPVEIEKRK